MLVVGASLGGWVGSLILLVTAAATVGAVWCLTRIGFIADREGVAIRNSVLSWRLSWHHVQWIGIAGIGLGGGPDTRVVSFKRNDSKRLVRAQATGINSGRYLSEIKAFAARQGWHPDERWLRIGASQAAATERE